MKLRYLTAAAILLGNVASQYPMTRPVAKELAALLVRYPARAVSRCFEQAVDELVAAGQGPAWPDAGEADAVVAVLGVFDTLARQQESPYYALRAAA